MEYNQNELPEDFLNQEAEIGYGDAVFKCTPKVGIFAIMFMSMLNTIELEEENVVDVISSLTENADNHDTKIPKEAFEIIEQMLVSEERYEFAKIVNTHIKYNYSGTILKDT